jgi:hypothetical protein
MSDFPIVFFCEFSYRINLDGSWVTVQVYYCTKLQ